MELDSVTFKKVKTATETKVTMVKKEKAEKPPAVDEEFKGDVYKQTKKDNLKHFKHLSRLVEQI